MSGLSPPRRARPKVLVAVTLAEVGGVASYLAQLLPGLTQEFEVLVAASGDGPLRDTAADLGLPFVELRQMRRSISPIHDAAAVLELASIMRRHRPDILHAHSSKAGLLARLAAWLTRVPVRIFTVHGWAFSAYKRPAGDLFKLAERGVRPMTTVVVCPSRSVMDEGVRARACSPDRSVVIPNAVDVDSYGPWNGGGGPARIVSVGRLAFPKNFHCLVEAFGRLPHDGWTAQIVGDGPQRAALEQAATELGLEREVQFLGTRHDVATLLARADIFVLSSDSECLPMSVIEAMASGLPVVASAVGGVPELVVDGKTGILVPPGEPGALADALGRLLEDRAAQRAMGTASRQRAHEQLDTPAFQRRHVDLYHEQLRRHGWIGRASEEASAASG